MLVMTANVAGRELLVIIPSAANARQLKGSFAGIAYLLGGVY